MPKNPEMPLTGHLAELRTRLITTAWILFLGFIACYFKSEILFDLMREPILPFLPAGTTGLHFINPFEKFVAHIKVSFLVSVIITMPFWLYQIWRFIAPGLYAKEKGYAISFIFFGVLLFSGGVLFAYKLVLPQTFHFLLTFGGTTDQPLITINEYFDFVFKFFLAFGLAFELPLILVFLVLMGVVDVELLRKNRRYAIVILAVIAALVTPPDALSMLALLVPLVLLYEISIWISILLKRR